LIVDDTGHRREQSTKRPDACLGAERGRVLIVFPGALGDFLLLAPAVATLVRGGARVEVSVTRSLTPLARALLDVPLGPPVDGAAMSSLFGADLAPEVAAWLHAADELQVWLGAAAADDVGRHAQARGVRVVATHAVVRGDGDEHATAVYARMLDVALPLVRPALSVALAPPFIWSAPRDQRLVVHPGAGHPAKRWDGKGFARIAAEWRRGGGEAVVLLGPAEATERRHWDDGGIPVVCDAPLLESAALLASAARFVGNDSGVSHLAAAAGARGVVLFGVTSPRRWAPRGGVLAPIVFTGRARDDVVAAVLDAVRAT
jgi:hypothetical protein